jgi:hypothetical protein
MDGAGARDVWTARAPLIIRVTSHVAVWLAVLVPVSVVLSKGWLPIGDDAAIAIRSSQTFSFYPPLVGLTSTAGNGLGHYLYDPGPLLFWLLAVPVHLDANHGLLWGAALLMGAAFSLSIEAVWSSKLWIGCAIVSFVAVDLLWLTPEVLENPAWNAFFPLPFFVASIVLAWRVGSGSFTWWPVLVFTASVAAQSHLVFVIPSVLLALSAPMLGLLTSDRPGRSRWFFWGLGVGLVCWIAPLVQNLGSYGNLTGLLKSGSGQTRYGLSFGLHMLARAGSPVPIWLTHRPLSFVALLSTTAPNSPVIGVIVLLLLALTVVFAWRHGNKALEVLSIVCLTCALSLVVAYSIVPLKNGISLYYLIAPLWIVGILIWTVLAWCLVDLVSLAISVHRDQRGAAPAANSYLMEPSIDGTADSAGDRRSGTRRAIVGFCAVAVIFLVGIAGFLQLHSFQPSEALVDWNQSDAASVRSVTQSIEQSIPKGRVFVSIRSNSSNALSTFWITEGVAWQLYSDGWTPGLASIGASYTGLQVPLHKDIAGVLVTLNGTKVTAVKRARCTAGIYKCVKALAASHQG